MKKEHGFLDDFPVPERVILTAAADHCLAAAYAGYCPSVSPTKLAIFRSKKKLNNYEEHSKKY